MIKMAVKGKIMNILLVDDDKLFIRKTIEGIKWDEIGIHRVFSAEDLQQALQVLNCFSVDIMLTDIEMPRGNGLELLEKVTQSYQSVDTLVISGYAHFSYAQKAMEFGAKRFLVKPVSNSELRETLKEIITDRKNNDTYHRKSVENVWAEGYTIIKGKDDVLGELYQIASNCPKEAYFCEVEFRILYKEAKSKTEKKLLICMINNVIMGFFDESSLALARIFQTERKRWKILIRKNSAEESITGILTRIQNYLEEMLHLQSCFYVGRTGTMTEVISNHDCFTQLCDNMIFFEQSILFQENCEKRLCGQVYLLDHAQLGDQFVNGDIFDVKKKILEYIKTLKKEQRADVRIFRKLLEHIDKMTMQYIEKHHVDFSQIFDEDEYQDKHNKALGSLQGMCDFVAYDMERLEGVRYLGSEKKQLVEKLKAFIDEHLNEELTRSRLSDSINFSGDYVARFFRAETGKTISEYIMEQRMERAKHYLIETKMSIGDISCEVGFNNFSYFSKAFKVYTGKTPNEYRVKGEIKD